jgi:hypothetical protein
MERPVARRMFWRQRRVLLSVSLPRSLYPLQTSHRFHKEGEPPSETDNRRAAESERVRQTQGHARAADLLATDW